MKHLKRKLYRSSCVDFTTFNIAVATLTVFLGLSTGRANAQEPVSPPPASPDSPVAAAEPAASADAPPADTASSANAASGDATPGDAPSADTASSDDLEARLNNLEQRLDKTGTDDLAPLSLILPGVSSNVPNAYGASQGMVALGFGYQNRLRFTDNREDGTVAAVIGLSDPRRLGADIQVSFLDLDSFGKRVALGFKLHRQFDNDIAVAVGGENSLVSSYSDSEASYYGVISKKLRLAESGSEPFSRLYLSAGLGNGRFLSEGDVFNNRGGINVFGSAAINVNRSTTAFTEWTGQSLNVGTSIVPFRKYPFVVTLALADVAGNGGDGTRFTAGFGYVFTR